MKTAKLKRFAFVSDGDRRECFISVLLSEERRLRVRLKLIHNPLLLCYSGDGTDPKTMATSKRKTKNALAK